jgi:hypothetical protein
MGRLGCVTPKWVLPLSGTLVDMRPAPGETCHHEEGDVRYKLQSFLLTHSATAYFPLNAGNKYTA